MRTLRRWLVPPPSYVAPLARQQISFRAQNAHATSVVDNATIVRRAFAATSDAGPCTISSSSYVAPLAQHQIYRRQQ
ncbi:hypothetical protein [Idiomarina baltica]|uniref:hypothetical protein n=1 Tax=Idiomarina baltica TaxID=190892 RepID=UPI002FDCE248